MHNPRPWTSNISEKNVWSMYDFEPLSIMKNYSPFQPLNNHPEPILNIIHHYHSRVVPPQKGPINGCEIYLGINTMYSHCAHLWLTKCWLTPREIQRNTLLPAQKKTTDCDPSEDPTHTIPGLKKSIRMHAEHRSRNGTTWDYNISCGRLPGTLCWHLHSLVRATPWRHLIDGHGVNGLNTQQAAPCCAWFFRG